MHHPPVAGPARENFPDAEELRHFDETVRAGEAKFARARELAATLIGLSVSEARDVVEQHPGLSLSVVNPAGSTAEAVCGRIKIRVVDGKIVDAYAA